MTRDGYNDGLDKIHLVHIFTDFESGLITIDKGHVTIHENKAVAASLILIGFDVAYNNVDGFLTVKAFRYLNCRIYPNNTLQDDFNRN